MATLQLIYLFFSFYFFFHVLRMLRSRDFVCLFVCLLTTVALLKMMKLPQRRRSSRLPSGLRTMRWMKGTRMIVSIVAIGLLCAPRIKGADPEIPRSKCDETQYMDISNFQCYSCGAPPNSPLPSPQTLAGRVPDYRYRVSPLPSDPAYSVSTRCKCAPGYKFEENYFDSNDVCTRNSNGWCDAFKCNKCQAGTPASSLDNSACMKCGDTKGDATFNDETGVCVCTDATRVLVERGEDGQYLEEKRCDACPPGHILKAALVTSALLETPTEADYYACAPCPHRGMKVAGGKCNCEAPWASVGVAGIGSGVTCVLQADLGVVNQASYSTIVYRSVGRPPADAAQASDAAPTFTTYTVKRSVIFEAYFQESGARCKFYRTNADLEACQRTANLCVLVDYDDDHPACEVYDNVHKDRREEWDDVSWDWKLAFPWLYYEKEVIFDTSIQMQMSFDMEKKPGTYDFMQFVLAKYALNGTFLGWENVANQFEYCTPTANKLAAWTKFGYGYSKTYECNLYRILDNFPEPVFYDPYLVDYGNSEKLFPVPVRVVNLRKRGRFPNVNEVPQDEEDDVYVRRFFLYDQISSKESVKEGPKLVRYAKKIVVTTSVQESAPSRILPPVIQIEYEETLVSDFASLGNDARGVPLEAATTVDVTFTAEYTESYDSFWTTANAFFGCFLTVSGLGVMLRLYNHSRRNSRVNAEAPVDLTFLLRAIFTVLSTFAMVMFWFIFFYSLWFFVFFKMQSNVHLLLPVDRPEYGILNDYHPFVVLLKLCFWGQIARMAELLAKQCNVDVFLVDWEKPRGKVASKRGDGSKTRFAPISVWRTIFMANEWNEMQTVRQYNLELTLIVFAALMIGADYRYLATPRPGVEDKTPGPLNPILRFANTSFWMIFIAYAQVLWRWLIQDRYITEPPSRSYVDLCTIAKISVIVLDEPFHGYYLHCRSQHEFADGNMLEISRQLRQESEGLTTDRGLPGAPTGTQTFELYLTGNWKRQYNHIYRTMMEQEIQGAKAETGSFLLRVFRGRGGAVPAERLVRASRKLNAFLRGFVDQTTTDFPYAHRDQTFSHRFLHLPPEMVGSKDTLLFADPSFSYSKVMYWGCTWELVLFNVLTFAMCDYWTENTVVAVFLTYFIDQIFEYFRASFGNANVASKTLVDSRFLK